jgi:PKD repeat protein
LGNQSGAGLGGIYIKNYPVFTGNNLYGNASYDLFNGNLAGAGDLKAEFNWWGTIELPEILSHIWDYLDDSTLSLVDFDPAWAYPQLGAPISPPTGLQILRDGNSLELSWNENPESDTAGYKIYYDTDGPGYPYNGSGLPQGDSPLDVGQVLNHTLTGIPDGVYHLSLTAYDSNRDGENDQTEGNESWFSDDVTVTVGQIPEAGFSAAPTTGPRPLSVNFTNLSSGNIASCSWDFGDGNGTDMCGNPSHTYLQAGSFAVTLTVSGPAGSDSEVKPGYIIVSPIPSHADFSAAPTSGVRPLEVHFTNLSGGDYTACNWNFGDGITSSNCSNPVHTYIQAGVYTVILSISGPGGMDMHSQVDLITVQEAYRNYLPLMLR